MNPNDKQSSPKAATVTNGVKDNTKSVRTRIAPSPTGFFHIGTARSALYNFLFAKKHNGEFIVRIEDTDKERSEEKYEKDILESMDWLALSFDESYKQSERTDIYKKYIEKLLSSGNAYVSNEEGREIIRLKNPNKEVAFNDLIRGDISFHTEELGDFIIARNTEDPLYHLAVVIDDHEMNITHVIRGEDHISNTPRQILIQEALGIKRPEYAHIPLILSKDRSKMSKRDGGTAIHEYKDKGYLPGAMVNYLALLGWSPEDDQEMFTLEELIKVFDLSRIHLGGAAFDEEKLKWFNGEYLKKLSDEEYKENIQVFLPKRITELDKYSEEGLKKVIPILKERIQVLSDLENFSSDGELDYYFTLPKYEKGSLIWKDSDIETTKEHIRSVISLLQSVPDNNFNKDSVKDAVWDYAEEKGRGAVLWPMRYALSGKDKSPDPFILAEVLGKEEALLRLENTLDL